MDIYDLFDAALDNFLEGRTSLTKEGDVELWSDIREQGRTKRKVQKLPNGTSIENVSVPSHPLNAFARSFYDRYGLLANKVSLLLDNIDVTPRFAYRQKHRHQADVYFKLHLNRDGLGIRSGRVWDKLVRNPPPHHGRPRKEATINPTVRAPVVFFWRGRGTLPNEGSWLLASGPTTNQAWEPQLAFTTRGFLSAWHRTPNTKEAANLYMSLETMFATGYDRTAKAVRWDLDDPLMEFACHKYHKVRIRELDNG